MFGRAPPPVSKRIFDKHDQDKSGYICAVEFKDLCYELGHYFTDEEINIAVKLIDKDGSGNITYDEFAKFWAQDNRFDALKKSPEELEKLQEHLENFKKHDADMSGVICRNEFQDVYNHLVETGITTKPLENCFADLDANGDGKISFNEYVEWLSRQY